MKRFNNLLLDIANEGAVAPSPPPFTTRLEKERIGNIVTEHLAKLYQRGVETCSLDDFKVDNNEKKLILNAIKKDLSLEKATVNKQSIDLMIKDFMWTVKNSGKLKELIENSRSTDD